METFAIQDDILSLNSFNITTFRFPTSSGPRYLSSLSYVPWLFDTVSNHFYRLSGMAFFTTSPSGFLLDALDNVGPGGSSNSPFVTCSAEWPFYGLVQLKNEESYQLQYFAAFPSNPLATLPATFTVSSRLQLATVSEEQAEKMMLGGRQHTRDTSTPFFGEG